MQKVQSIVTLIAIAIAILAMTGVLNPYKKKYLAELEQVRKASEAREDSLKTVVFSLENEALRLQRSAEHLQMQVMRLKERDQAEKK